MGTDPVRLLVTDVDNTLFDWNHTWAESFRAMLTSVSEDAGIEPLTLTREAHLIHQKNRTVEYAFLLQELPSLRLSADRDRTIARAIEAFREARAETMFPYPTVIETLLCLKENGWKIAAFTESQSFYASYKIRTLGLDGIVDCLYSREDHPIPEEIDLSVVRTKSSETYLLKGTRHEILPNFLKKPDPEVLRDIAFEFGAPHTAVAYIGDSLAKDIVMARRAGIFDIFASYGTKVSEADLELLVSVSFWTDEEIAELSEGDPEIVPSCSVDQFAEVLTPLLGSRF